jgi:hypothetical protein
MPCCIVTLRFAVPPGRRFDRAVGQALQRDAALHQFLLQNVVHRLEFVLVGGVQHDRVFFQFDIRFESFRSKRVWISFNACWMAFDTSCRSILLTMSKVLSGIGFQFFLK